MDSDMIMLELGEKMEKALQNLEKRFATVRAGRANPSSLDGIMVEYYGSMTPLKQLATISVPEARQLLIKPFDRGSLKNIEKAILTSNLGYNPGNDGETIRIIIPELTEERRKELVKQVKAISEEGKVAIRNIRREAMDDIEKLELSEDEEKGIEKDIQDIVNEYNKKVEAKLKEKEQELLTV
ncbi:MAG: ribosome recycling factor [Tenericutes bacterium]|nr:ribosome recycling factor [Mycoplasmatota bacterium]